MKLTLNINRRIMAQLKKEAARRECTVSEVVEIALRIRFGAQNKRQRLAPLPKFRSGGTLVDIADRDALYRAIESR